MITDHRVPIAHEPGNATAAPSRIGPSFLIRRAAIATSRNAPGAASTDLSRLPLDRIDSRRLLAAARSIYFHFLSGGAPCEEPAGVVLRGDGDQGRVVFEQPVLLPDEQFVPIELLALRSLGRGTRAGRGGGARPPR